MGGNEAIGFSTFDPLYHDETAKLISEALETKDAIGRILRIHLAVEMRLQQLVKKVSGQDATRLQFSTLILAVRCMSVDPKICDLAKRLNELRNKFAHTPDATLESTKTVAEDIVRRNSDLLPNFDAVEVNLGNSKPRAFAKLELYDQVVVVAAILASHFHGMAQRGNFVAPNVSIPRNTRNTR
ncbi:hypothetical protein MXMO3_01227 [Maritalea myrionectae]|uniref:DUF4145 domain-containing protein n=1 Tax=Maritalea myrionectae TaxID=454601 RepID=A0A2R4MCI8_9HYPH|nr:hypothetical protein [Maritalea myrionectae]AVX03758.1 hypothetical protein MXMO3_01227 [Maritalea myrionectae]